MSAPKSETELAAAQTAERDLARVLYSDMGGDFWPFVGHPYDPPRARMDRCRLLARGLLNHFALAASHPKS